MLPEHKCFSLALTAKRNCEIPAIQPLETILVTFKPQIGTQTYPLEVIPDTGAKVTNVPASLAPKIELHESKVVLRAANKTPVKVIGAFQASIGIKHNRTDKIV
jgi:hypothetical protein